MMLLTYSNVTPLWQRYAVASQLAFMPLWQRYAVASQLAFMPLHHNIQKETLENLCSAVAKRYLPRWKFKLFLFIIDND
jgi:hypothetical protein